MLKKNSINHQYVRRKHLIINVVGVTLSIFALVSIIMVSTMKRFHESPQIEQNRLQQSKQQTYKPTENKEVEKKFVPSMKWQKRWWEDIAFNSKLPIPNSNCSLCTFTPTQIDPSSSSNDAIITVAMDMIWGLPTTIRSIRTAGIKSAVVILADHTAYTEISKSIQFLIDDCGIIVIDIGTLDDHQLKGRYRTRWHLAYDYFRLNPHNFTRFIMTDAYDSFFQGDPFLTTLRDDSLYFSTESITVGKCMHNSKWIGSIYPESLKDMREFPIICAGPVAGGVQPLLKFCELMFNLDMWTKKWDMPPDQAYLNYVVRTGMLESAKMLYQVIPNDGFMTTVGYCDRKGPLMVDKNGNIGCPGFKTTPMLLHQYVRPKNMRGHMFDVCNSTIPWSFKNNPYSKEKF